MISASSKFTQVFYDHRGVLIDPSKTGRSLHRFGWAEGGRRDAVENPSVFIALRGAQAWPYIHDRHLRWRLWIGHEQR